VARWNEGGKGLDLSVVVVNWNTRDLLERCMQSLKQTVFESEDTDAEVFVVDNASTDGSAMMIRERYPWANLIENTENVGFASANNQALRQAKGRYVVLLNSDTEVFPGAFETLKAFMDSSPKAGACGPRLLNEDGSLQSSCHPMQTPEREFWRLMFLEHLWRRATYPQDRWGNQEPRRVEVIKGACLFLRREALGDVGPLDELYFMYTEEMDLCYRLLQAGWELWWVPQAVVKHYDGASSKQVAESMYVQLYRSKVQFHRKFGGERRARWYKFLIGLAYTPRWWVVAALSAFSDRLVARARTYRRLLSELPRM